MSAEVRCPRAQGQIWEAPPAAESEPNAPSPAEPSPKPELRFKTINRQQKTWAAIDVEELVPADHFVRGIWEMLGRVDWSQFCAEYKAVEGQAGCSPYEPRLLAGLWILAYSEGVSSSHEVERRCEYHPAYRWLTSMEVVGYHTLSTFRVKYKAELDQLFAQVLALLQSDGLIRLERVMQDGTKVQAATSLASFHREATLQQHWEQAWQRVQEMGDPRQEPGERSARQQAAQERAARERWERLSQALEEMPKVRSENRETEPEECRVSATEAEARKMKHAVGGGYAPSYNLQVVSDAAQDMIVAVQVVQARNDQGQLEAGLDELQRQTGVVPAQAVVDEGYVSRATVLNMEQRGVDLIGGGELEENKNARRSQQNWEKRGVTAEFYASALVYDAERDLYRCPAGQELRHRGEKHDREGVERHNYRAGVQQCRGCPHQPQCCPVPAGKKVKGRLVVRTVNGAVVAAYREKMKSAEAKAIYRQRKRVAEFPNLWLKEKLGLRRFRVRGLIKARCEALWACLTYNLQQWVRIRWRPQLVASAA